MKKLLMLYVSVFILVINGCNNTGLKYPESRRVSQTDEYHGIVVADPYRWLEKLDSEETKLWVRAQNEVSITYLAHIPGREILKKRLTQLWNYERYGIPFKKGGKYFFTHNDGLQDQNVLYVSDSLHAEPRVLIDPNTFSADATISLRRYSVSPDGKYIAYALSDGGSDWTTWKVRLVDTIEDLNDFLDFIKFSGVSWSKDNNGFYYSRYPQGPDGKGDGSKPVAIYFHKLGDKQEQDKKVYDIPDKPSRDPYGTVTEDGRYLVINILEGFQTNAIRIMDLKSANKNIVPLFDKWDALYSVLGNREFVFYVKTNNNAPLDRIVAVDLTNPEPDKWREIVPQAEETLQNADYVGSYFTAQYLKDAHSVVRIYTSDGEMQSEVALPGIGTASGFQGMPDDPETFYSFTTFISPPKIYVYNVKTGETSLFAESKLQDVDPDKYETQQIFYTSTDGTRIPMFITHRKGLEIDGSTPTLLYGYGGFNASLTPRFSVSNLVWIEMGGIYALPNIRGGGEYGESWHLAGTKTNKQNVFDDFIAAAEWLIDNKYTSSSKLAISGASNGGLLVAACMVQRPDLFAAVLPAVGVLDMLRYHLPSANARNWSSDYGLSENADEFKALYAYSPYHNLKKGICYPPTLITTADHDDRVVPWHSFKFGAALQHAQGCSNAIILRIETRAGHGSGTPTWMRIEQVTDRLSFLRKNLDME